jgi:hypothetical protein
MYADSAQQVVGFGGMMRLISKSSYLGWLMKIHWLAVLAVLFLSPLGRAEENRHRAAVAGNVEASRELGGHIAGRLIGRVLACFIRRGMTMEQVEQVLGRDHLDSGRLTGHFIRWYWRYDIYEMIVSFASDEDHEIRVDSVSFR